ncbi:MAG: hypothetical protein K2Y16_12095 [Burkholderiales bacterium]|nr:hypothetical protein [Burkholderiales bacterium]
MSALIDGLTGRRRHHGAHHRRGALRTVGRHRDRREPARSVKGLIALAQGKPGALNFASNGVGTLSHLTGELFMQRTGARQA